MRLQIALRLAIVAAAALGMTSLASAATWQNPTDADDVDNSGVIAPRDALIDVNRLNLVGIGAVPSSGSPPPYYDVTGDDLVTPADALHVFNRLVANAGSAAPAGAAVPSEPGDPQVAIELVVTDSGGTPVSIASPGQALLLEVFAEDLRVSPPFAGVFSASTDIAATDVSFLAGSAVYEPNWFADSPATYAPAQVTELNATSTSLSPGGSSPELLFNIAFFAGSPGVATFTSSASSASELHDFLLYGDDNPIPLEQVVFGTTTLTIVPEPATWSLAAMGAVALGTFARVRRKR
jgi:PEP-CTERM motif/Dockerin type I domain